MKRRPLYDSKRYTDFNKARDLALEVLLRKCHLETSEILGVFLQASLDLISARYPLIVMAGFNTAQGKATTVQLDAAIHAMANQLLPRVIESIVRMRKHSALLAYAAEVEAMARALGGGGRVNATKSALTQSSTADLADSGSLIGRVDLEFSRIRRDIMDAVELSRVMESPLDECLERVKKSFPPEKRYKRPPRVLKSPSLREADDVEGWDTALSFRVKDGKSTLVEGFIDPEEWAEMVDNYMTRFTPSLRAPDLAWEEGEEITYGWQVEQQVTHDFVSTVRAGQNKAAAERGIKDFIWVAILDSDTCKECCAWRNGLTTREIEAQLKGKHKDDDCDSLVPPAHFNCRCDISPMVNTDEWPEETPPDFGAFDEWLNS